MALFCWIAVILVIASAVARFSHRRKLACWGLIVFSTSLCFGLWFDLSHDTMKPGQPGYHSDLSTLPYLIGFLVATLIVALRPQWGWLFWMLWVLSALVSVLIVFATFILG